MSIAEKNFYSRTSPKGTHTVKVWASTKNKNKFSFSCAYGAGVMSFCEEYEKDNDYQFGQFDTVEEAIEAGRKVIFGD